MVWMTMRKHKTKRGKEKERVKEGPVHMKVNDDEKA